MKILRMRQLLEKVPYSPMHISRLEKAGKFPKRIKLNPPNGQAVGWSEEEIDQHILDLIAERDAEAA